MEEEMKEYALYVLLFVMINALVVASALIWSGDIDVRHLMNVYF